MSEWWTYSLSDFLLFSPRTYYRLFELYHAAVWPAQLLAIAAGLAVIGLMWRGSSRLAIAVLAACWLWVAWGFLFTRYATINWAASYVAAAFAAEAALLLVFAVFGRTAKRGPGPTSRVGLGLVVFAVLVQPWVGILAGRDWRQLELFGLTPDPTVVATLGVAAAVPHWGRWLLLAVPILWCVAGSATLWALGSAEAVILPAAAMLAVTAAWKWSADLQVR